MSTPTTDNTLYVSASPSADFYRRLMEQAAVAMIATDSQFNVVCLNGSAAHLLGRDPKGMLGHPLRDVVPPDRHKLLDRLLQRTASGAGMSELEFRMADAQGEEHDLLVVLSPVPGEGGATQGVSAWIVDQTHRNRLNERLAQAEKMASLGTLAGGVAHHFNNILGGVATFVDYALTSGDHAAMRRALQMTAEAAARAAKITQSLLSFAAKDTHRYDMADLTEVVLTFVHLVERPLAEKDIKVHLDLRPVAITAVEANRMHQVLGNLLTNAEEAMPKGGTITITIDRGHEAGSVKLTFEDTGCGIEEAHLPLVFEPFFTTKGLLSGGNKANPGLGLSVVHGIITDMGGKISVDSRLGEWTRFTIVIPPAAKG